MNSSTDKSKLILLALAVGGVWYMASGSKPTAPVNPAPVPIKPMPVVRPVVLMFTASWCPQCKHFESEVLSRQEVKDALNLFDFRVINSDGDKEAVKKYKVTALPTFIKLDGGRHVGYMQPGEFVSWLNSKKDTDE